MMMDIKTFRDHALSFPEAVEEPHFEKTSFRVRKKIFASFDEKNNRACIKLSEIEQDIFSTFDNTAIYPLPNSWGKQGWTYIEFDKVREDICLDALKSSYKEVAPKKLSELLGEDIE